MDSRCRVCRRSDVDELVSISCVSTTQQKRISEMISVTIGAMLEDNDRLPQHICAKCRRQLDRAYRICTNFRASRRLPRCQKGQENKYYRCRVCARQDAEELLFLTCICDRWKVSIDKMILFMVNEVVGSDDCLPPYICDTCLRDLNVAYGFKKQYIQSLSTFRKELLFAWEKMEFQRDDPGQLVEDLYAELIPNVTKQKKEHGLSSAYCSVCQLETALDQLGQECKGCLLEFVASNDIQIKIESPQKKQSSEVDTANVMDYDAISSENLIQMEWMPVEEDTFQEDEFQEDEYQEDEYQEDEYQEDEVPEDEDEDYQDRVHKVKKMNVNPWAHLDVDTLFDIVEDNSKEPLQKVRRKGPVCCGCNQFFLTEQELLEHREIQHSTFSGSQKHICEFCLNSFSTLTCLTKHMKQQEQDTYYWCKPCKVLLADNHLLPMHQFSYHMPENAEEEASGKFTSKVIVVNSCRVMGCRKRFNTEEQVLQHYNTTHHHEDTGDDETDSAKDANKKVELGVYRCKIDGCTFVTKRKVHIIWHCSQKPHVKPIYAKKISLKRFIPNAKHFNVAGTLSDGIEILERQQGEFCCGCHKFCETDDDMQKHLAKCHASTNVEDGNSFRCTVCNKDFPTESAISLHINNMANRKHYFCKPCQFFLFDKRRLNHHVAWCHTNEDDAVVDETRQSYETIMDDFFTCCACEEKFDEERNLLEHHRDNHPEPDTTRHAYRCKICRKKYCNSAQLERHTAMYVSKTIYKCQVKDCIFQTKSLPAIKRHAAISSHQGLHGELRVHNINPTEYFCCVPGCEHITIEYDSMIEHGLNNHNTKRENNSIQFEDRQFKCLVCFKGFDHEFKLINHKNGKAMVHCPRCDITIKRAEYRAHLEQCQISHKYTCDICSREFTSKRLLRNHLSHHKHEQKRQIAATTICSVCGKLLQVGSMPDHMLAHENKRIWKCKQCPLSFNTKQLLLIHTRVHTGEKKFECRYGCGNRYKAGGDRNRHEKLVHLGIREFSCQYCSESFVRERDLRLHCRKHTGLKLYPCETCGDSFDKLSEYKQHEATCRIGSS